MKKHLSIIVALSRGILRLWENKRAAGVVLMGYLALLGFSAFVQARYSAHDLWSPGWFCRSAIFLMQSFINLAVLFLLSIPDGNVKLGLEKAFRFFVQALFSRKEILGIFLAQCVFYMFTEFYFAEMIANKSSSPHIGGVKIFGLSGFLAVGACAVLFAASWQWLLALVTQDYLKGKNQQLLRIVAGKRPAWFAVVRLHCLLLIISAVYDALNTVALSGLEDSPAISADSIIYVMSGFHGLGSVLNGLICFAAVAELCRPQPEH